MPNSGKVAGLLSYSGSLNTVPRRTTPFYLIKFNFNTPEAGLNALSQCSIVEGVERTLSYANENEMQGFVNANSGKDWHEKRVRGQ